MDFVLYSYIKWCFCISVSNCSLLICKNTTDIFISVSHSITLINHLLVLVAFWEFICIFCTCDHVVWGEWMTILLLPFRSLQFFFFFLVVLAMSSRTILTRNDENKQHCLVSYLSTINYDVSFKFLAYAIHKTEKVLCWEFLSWMNVQFQPILFLHSLRGNYVLFLSYSTDIMDYIDLHWFLNV